MFTAFLRLQRVETPSQYLSGLALRGRLTALALLPLLPSPGLFGGLPQQRVALGGRADTSDALLQIVACLQHAHWVPPCRAGLILQLPGLSWAGTLGKGMSASREQLSLSEAVTSPAVQSLIKLLERQDVVLDTYPLFSICVFPLGRGVSPQQCYGDQAVGLLKHQVISGVLAKDSGHLQAQVCLLLAHFFFTLGLCLVMHGDYFWLHP